MTSEPRKKRTHGSKRQRPVASTMPPSRDEGDTALIDESEPEARAGGLFSRVSGSMVVLAGLATVLTVGGLSGLAPALLVSGGATLFVAIGLFWTSLRTLTGDAPLPPSAHAIGFGVPDPLAERKVQTLRALKDLEFERSVGKIDEADFLDLSTRYRTAAKDIMRELDAGLAPRRAQALRLVEEYLKGEQQERGEASSDNVSPDPLRTVCAACQTSNDDDAAFCKKCGGRLSTAADRTESSDEPR
jgi:hypothetical protein